MELVDNCLLSYYTILGRCTSSLANVDLRRSNDQNRRTCAFKSLIRSDKDKLVWHSLLHRYHFVNQSPNAGYLAFVSETRKIVLRSATHFTLKVLIHPKFIVDTGKPPIRYASQLMNEFKIVRDQFPNDFRQLISKQSQRI